MEHALILKRTNEQTGEWRPVAADTTFVLFFLAVDLGASFTGAGSVGIVLSLAALAAFIGLPYFLLFDDERPDFWPWAAGRGAIALLGALIGAGFTAAIGVVLPEYFRHLPMTFLIIAAVSSAFIQFYGMIKVRLAS
jgi:hypothetical protein